MESLLIKGFRGFDDEWHKYYFIINFLYPQLIRIHIHFYELICEEKSINGICYLFKYTEIGVPLRYVYNRITPHHKNRAWCYPSFYPALPLSLLHSANGKSGNEIPLQKGIQTDDGEHR